MAGIFAVFIAGSLVLMFVVGRDFFPYVDSGQMRLHVRTPECTRIEETEHIFGQVDREIRRLIPANEIAEILDNIGLPNSGINLAFGDNSTIASSDADILISLNPTTKSKGTEEYTRILRDDLRGRFPQETFFFQAANITNQILNFGLPMPIDVQIVGRNANQNYQLAREIRDKAALVPGAVDVFVRQEPSRHGTLQEQSLKIELEHMRPVCPRIFWSCNTRALWRRPGPRKWRPQRLCEGAGRLGARSGPDAGEP